MKKRINHTEVRDGCLVAQDGPGSEMNPLSNVALSSNDGSLNHRMGPDPCPAPYHAVLDQSIFLNPAVCSNNGVFDNHSRFQNAPFIENRVGVQVDLLFIPIGGDSRLFRIAGPFHPARNNAVVSLEIFFGTSDVLPVAGGQVGKDQRALLEHGWKDFSFEALGTFFGNMIQH